MLEKSFGLLFFLRKPREYDGGLMYIYLRITVDGEPKEVSVKRYATTTNSSGACVTKGLMADGYYSFPYPTNPNYNFERGLLQNT